MLVHPDALSAAGGMEAIRGAIIEDCALAKRLKAGGPIWLGLTVAGAEHAVVRNRRPDQAR